MLIRQCSRAHLHVIPDLTTSYRLRSVPQPPDLLQVARGSSADKVAQMAYGPSEGISQGMAHFCGSCAVISCFLPIMSLDTALLASVALFERVSIFSVIMAWGSHCRGLTPLTIA